MLHGACSPRTWGWTDRERGHRATRPMLPTHVGMDRRTRGCVQRAGLCSPRTWGWTAIRHVTNAALVMLPTHVGMDRMRSRAGASASACSPRTWGWTGTYRAAVSTGSMLPTHVGMDRQLFGGVTPPQYAPHARGDGPRLVSAALRFWECSPRTWGWTVRTYQRTKSRIMLPTHVGMDRPTMTTNTARLHAPHARGDGPPPSEFHCSGLECSPRTWGWTAHLGRDQPDQVMLPTHVGMDHRTSRGLAEREHAPHARGDGP